MNPPPRHPRSIAVSLSFAMVFLAAGIAAQAAGPQRLEKLSFDPESCKYLDKIRSAVPMTGAEAEMFKRQGFVVLDRQRHDTFPMAYYHVFSRDLPVMITSDSILHAVHRSFDDILKEMEERSISWRMTKVLEACHAELARRAMPQGDAFAANYADMDLYLTVARNLLAGAATTGRAASRSERGQDEEVQKIIRLIQSRQMQDPLAGEKTAIFGGQRAIDYSQFIPRGHYTKSQQLQNYFYMMMWLGRADCGFSVLPAHPESGINNNADRELRDAVLAVDLLTTVGKLDDLAKVDALLEFLIGRSDNLRPGELQRLMAECKVTGLADLGNAETERQLQEKIAKCPSAAQRIRSQVVFGSKHPGEQIPPPGLFQFFGQRFAVDSYVLAGVVYDAVPITRSGGRRFMPRSLDVMAALGNEAAWGLLSGDLAKYEYRPQLTAARDFTTRYFADPAGQTSLYDLWLAALGTLHADMSQERLFPQAMRTEAWALKQLHTQLASWAELRHDGGILYVKQSYTSREECDYPAAFVEPYPEFYARVRALAQRAEEGFGKFEAAGQRAYSSQYQSHWRNMATVMEKLEGLARKELRGEPFSDDEVKFLKQAVSVRSYDDSGCAMAPPPGHRRGPHPDPLPKGEGDGMVYCSLGGDEQVELALGPRGSGHETRHYNGWYCGLFYNSDTKLEDFQPTVADVHSDTNGQQVLEVGVGHARLAVVAVDNGPDRMAYVAPVYTYYEFTQPISQRMTDEEFKSRLTGFSRRPARPDWVRAFEAGAGDR